MKYHLLVASVSEMAMVMELICVVAISPYVIPLFEQKFGKSLQSCKPGISACEVELRRGIDDIR